MNRILLAIVLFVVPSTLAGQYYFGRNKVHYDHFEWRILKTEHFDIYYYPEMRELAEIGASYAEEAYQRLMIRFDINIARKIPLIFYSNHLHFQQTNTTPALVSPGVGGFFEFLKGRVVIPANGSLHDFRHVINHELVHVFMHTRSLRTLRDHRKSHFPLPPLWFIEGLAEYWSEGWDSEAEMFIRDATVTGYLVPLSQMYRIFGTFLMYKEGQAICRFIAEKYGEEKLLQLIDNLWMSENFDEVMLLTLGLNYQQFDEQWTYYLRKQKYPLLQQTDLPGMVAERLTSTGINTKPTMCLVGDEERILFLSNRVGYSNIYSMPYSSNHSEDSVRVLIKGERTSLFEAFNLLKSKIDGNDRGEFVFVAKSRGKDAIYRAEAANGRIITRLQFDDIVTLFSPAWHPDGEQIVFTGVDFSGRSDLYIYNFSTAELKRLTNDFYDDRDAVWSPDGKYLAFSSDRTRFGQEGAYNIFIYDLAGDDIYFLTYGSAKDVTPAWSADGSMLAFVSDRSGTPNIWAVRRPQDKLALLSAGSEMLRDGHQPPFPSAFYGEKPLRQITHFTTGAFDPEWSDDGSLLFTAFENFSFQLRRLRDVASLYDKAEVARRDSLLTLTPPWQIPSFAAKSSLSSVVYRKKFNLDVAQSQITQDPIFGTSGGAQLAMSDMLGNQQYYFLIYNTAQTRDDFLGSFNVAVTRVDLSKRLNTAIGGYHFAGTYYNYAQGFYYERRYGGFASVSYPLSVFQRIEGSLNVRVSDKNIFGLIDRRALLVSNFVSWVGDNSLWGASGPLDGERFNFTIGNTLDVWESNVNFYTIIADYRRYFRLSTRMTLATRLYTAINQGKEALPFFLGGSWDLRLYPRWQIWGKKSFLISNELRFPFIDRFIVSFPFGGLGFSAIRGAAFVDLGNSWDSRLNTVLGSYGLGIRLRVGGFLVLRYDVGRVFSLHGLRSDSGYSFFHDREWKTQFFFGWDF